MSAGPPTTLSTTELPARHSRNQGFFTTEGTEDTELNLGMNFILFQFPSGHSASSSAAGGQHPTTFRSFRAFRSSNLPPGSVDDYGRRLRPTIGNLTDHRPPTTRIGRRFPRRVFRASCFGFLSSFRLREATTAGQVGISSFVILSRRSGDRRSRGGRDSVEPGARKDEGPDHDPDHGLFMIPAREHTRLISPTPITYSNHLL